MNTYGLFLCLSFVQAVICLQDDTLKSFCWYRSLFRADDDSRTHFHIRDINTSLCTHLIYNYARIDHERWVPMGTNMFGKQGQDAFTDFTSLKLNNSKLKVLLAVGGSDWSGDIEAIVQSRGLMVEFAKNTAIFLRDREFDGLVLDWERPPVEARDLFGYLVEIIRDEFNRDASWTNNTRDLLAVTGSPDPKIIAHSNNIGRISRFADYLLIYSFDFSGPWSHVTAFSDPIYSEISNSTYPTSQEGVIDLWISAGAPENKLVLGMNGIALTYTLVNRSNTEVGAMVSGPGQVGPYLNTSGYATYFRVCDLNKQAENTSSEVIVWDDERKMSYTVIGDQWVGYNTPRSMREKVRFAYKRQLAGTAFFYLGLDDFTGTHCDQGKYPLLSAINSAIQDLKPSIPGTSIIG